MTKNIIKGDIYEKLTIQKKFVTDNKQKQLYNKNHNNNTKSTTIKNQ